MEVLVTHNRATDGRPVLHVKLERMSKESDAPVVEIIYSIQWPQNFSIVEDTTVVLLPISCTRTDTRETVTLTSEEQQVALENAVDYVSTLDWN